MGDITQVVPKDWKVVNSDGTVAVKSPQDLLEEAWSTLTVGTTGFSPAVSTGNLFINNPSYPIQDFRYVSWPPPTFPPPAGSVTPSEMLVVLGQLLQTLKALQTVTHEWSLKYDEMKALRDVSVLQSAALFGDKVKLEAEVTELRKKVTELQELIVPGRFDGMDLE